MQSIGRLDLVHRRFRVIAAVRAGKPAAAVFEGTTRLFVAFDATLEHAVEQAKAWIDQHLDGEKAQRRKPYIATTSEYRRAFRALRLGRHHVDMLRQHANAPGRAMNMTELARSAGYSDFSTANLHYGGLGHRIAEFLDLSPDIDERRGQPVWTMTLAAGAPTLDVRDHWPWVMHPEVAQALRDLNMT